jgi:hypothetical protein
MRCSDCQRKVDPSEAIAGNCRDCFFAKVGTIKDVPKERWAEAKRTIEAETAGLVPASGLRQIFEAFYEAVAGGAQLDRAIDEHALMVQRLAGLGACREMLKFSDTLGTLATEWEGFIRDKISKLSKIGE